VLVDGGEVGDRVAAGDVDPEPAVDDADVVGRVDDAVRGEPDRSREIGVTGGSTAVPAVRDRDGLAVGGRTGSRLAPGRVRVEGTCNRLHASRAVEPDRDGELRACERGDARGDEHELAHRILPVVAVCAGRITPDPQAERRDS
jgi:hypothetical protein